VETGGTASGTVVKSGGTMELFGGAIASGFTINPGGFLEIASGFTETGFVVSSGVTLEVSSGGAVSNTTVSSGGVEQVFNGGIASGTMVNAGGLEYVSSGGTASGTMIEGGMVEVASGGSTGSGAITFTSAGGDLQLDASLSFHGLIAGFGSPQGVTEEIDLRDISFGKATHLKFTEAADHLSGTLTVKDGPNTVTLTLLGQYSAANFSLASDGHGGTIITDPPAMVGSAASPVLAAHPT
jgi:autotransporter passenger strand-loop-strand repeat protein